MPGIVVFGRRWSAGSDDMVIPSLPLVLLHTVWLVCLSVIFGKVKFDTSVKCSDELREVMLGYIVILSVCLVVEIAVVAISLRGGILDTKPRTSMQYLLYIRLVVFLGELAWLVVGIKWIVYHFTTCSPNAARQAILGISVFTSCMILILVIALWCTFDSAGRKWVKMKRFQESMKEKTRRSRRSGSARRNWRQRTRQSRYFFEKMERKALRAYEESWDRRLGLMCCCVDRKGRNKNSMSEIAQLFTEFFRDLDVVPSDVVAGLVLLRRYQKLRMQDTIQQHSNDVYRYLSGIPVTPRTQFLQLGQQDVLQQYKLVIHYMKFAMAAYGWPIFMMMNTGTGLCRMVPYLRCCCCSSCCTKGHEYVLDDNCCQCNLVALKKISGLPDVDLVYVTYHVDIGETPFYVALDKQHKKIVICVRGTLSLQDVLTDLKADAETLPLDPVREDWVGHKGMVQAAIYIKNKLKEDLILAKAFEKCKECSTDKYELVLVGHSLGAGTAAILAIMLQQEYPELHCYAYSPPGGLLSYECMEATKSYITSVVVGKDVVPRIGLPQMELLRTDLINIIKKSSNPKWKIIVKALCCGSESASNMTFENVRPDVERDVTAHPSDEQIGLTAHKPMFPPGKIILVVRNHPTGKRSCCGSKEPVYQAIWADNSDFQEVLVSPTMVNDHMPDNVMEALEKVLVNVAPPKPNRLLTETERKELLNHDTSPGTPESPLSLNYHPITATVAGDLHSNPVGYHGNITDHNQILVNNLGNTGKTADFNNVNININVNSLDWDAMTEEILLSLDRQNLFPGIGEYPRLEMDLGTDWIEAPLATPELLSAASSMCTLNRTNSGPKGEPKSESVSASAKLETIQQSPDLKLSRSESPAKGSVGDTCDNISDTEDIADIPSTPSCDSLNDLFLKPHRLRALNGDLKDISNGSMNNLLKNSDLRNSGDVPSRAISVVNCKAASHSSCNLSDDISVTSLGINISVPTASSDVLYSLHPSDKSSNVETDFTCDRTANDETQKYERHSPDDCEEMMQFGYGNPNEIYSPAGVGYHPPTFYGHPSHLSHHSSVVVRSPSKAPSPSNKRLQYSQSESKLKALSDIYQMKRSTEAGDIAHLKDSSQIFVGDENNKCKRLKTRESDRTLIKDVNRLVSVEEDCSGPSSIKKSTALCDFNPEKSKVIENENATALCDFNPEKTKVIENENGKSSCFTEYSDDEDNVGDDDSKYLLGRKRSKKDKNVFNYEDDDSTLTQVTEPQSLHSPMDGVGGVVSAPGRELYEGEEGEPRLFNSFSYHSTSASSFSGESDKHLSSVSGQSDEAELPIIETDV